MSTDKAGIRGERVRRLAVGAWLVGVIAVMGFGTHRELPAQPPESEPTRVLEPSRVLSGSVLYESSDLAVPGGLEVLGDRLILADDFADMNLRVIRRSDGALERVFGRKGRGPREFEAVLSMDVLDPTGQVMVYDPVLQRVTWIDLDADFDGDRWVADRSVSLNAPAMVLATAWTSTGLFGVGGFTDGRLAELTASGRFVRTTGTVPVSPETVTPRVWTRAFQGRLKARPDRQRFALVSRYADRLEIYGRDGALVSTGDRLFDFDPSDLRTEDPNAVRFGYLDIATTETRIYALFSGRLRGDGDAYLGDRIHVFDWNGRLVDVWALDTRLMAIAITPDDDRLYGVRHNPEPAVLAYRLN